MVLADYTFSQIRPRLPALTLAYLLLVISASISHDLFKSIITPGINEKQELTLARVSAGFAASKRVTSESIRVCRPVAARIRIHERT